jgi:hypothetical protein
MRYFSAIVTGEEAIELQKQLPCVISPGQQLWQANASPSFQ